MENQWRRRDSEEIKKRVFDALKKNVSYIRQHVLGVPGSFLDPKVFNRDMTFLKDAPFLSSLLENPNHIGCHTLESSEPFFAGTQSLERELLKICAVDILKAEEGSYDGYVTSGGTEANIQAIWMYRNYFQEVTNASLDQITVICSEDSHYSIDKGANLLSLGLFKVRVENRSRKLDLEQLREYLRRNNQQRLIVVLNMMTTMFGSVDDINAVIEVLKQEKVEFKLHIDGAYGGFYYPFTTESDTYTFKNSNISSFTLDAHKMAQSPYGTGIFLVRKGFIKYTQTKAARYVKGQDYTLIGSRSGANTIAVWMILNSYGPHGWREKVQTLQRRTEWLEEKLSALGIGYYRSKHSNILTIEAEEVSEEIAKKYWLVPDNHLNPKWQKLVIMDHVTLDILEQFVNELQTGRAKL